MLFLLLVMVGGLAAQKNQSPQWKEYTYQEDGFAISAPAPPAIAPDPQAADVQIYRWELAPNVLFTIHSGARPNCPNVLASLKNSLLKNQYGEYVPGSRKDISLSGNAGFEYEMALKTGRKTFERLYCTKGKSFSLTVAYPGNQTRSATADKMFSSFRLLSSH
ncbi:MAG TPA: hypothetical protein VGN44_01375 [Candidatus Angelobacter sp.]